MQIAQFAESFLGNTWLDLYGTFGKCLRKITQCNDKAIEFLHSSEGLFVAGSEVRVKTRLSPRHDAAGDATHNGNRDE